MASKASRPPPERPKEDESDSDDGGDVIGPMPPKSGSSGAASSSSIAADFERRSAKMRDRIEGKDEDKGEPKREQWMIELPPEKAKNFGLGPRTFSKSKAEPTKKRNEWTDTPEMKAKRARGELVEEDEGAGGGGSGNPEQDKDVLDYLASIKRDQEMEKVTQELREKRGTESLMEKHTKKLAKKAKKEEKSGKPKERRPFDRDVDLQANRFDNAAKAAMLKKAAKLDGRFSSGSSKYL